MSNSKNGKLLGHRLDVWNSQETLRVQPFKNSFDMYDQYKIIFFQVIEEKDDLVWEKRVERYLNLRLGQF